MIRRFTISFATLALVCIASMSTASAQEPMDFSDASEQLVNWPFNVVEYWVEDDGLNVWQHTRVSETPEDVFEYLRDLKRSGTPLGPFTLTGAAKNPEPRNFQITFFRDNTRFSVQIKPDGAGAVLVVKSTPNAIRSGYFKRALYGYRLGDGMRVGVERYDHRDE